MEPPVRPPVAPMLAKLVRELPRDGYLYEPKWDGFRCLAFVGAEDVELRSRNDRPLARYFPEIVDGLRAVGRAGSLVLDGELVLFREDRLDFPALMARLHPAASRVDRLRRETPARFVAFDLLAAAAEDLRERPFEARRARLEQVLAGVRPPIQATPVTDDPDAATAWLERLPGGGIDGVVAKHRTLRYLPGKRAMVKVKRDRTAECVVGGFRWLVDAPVVGSLLLGLYDGDGRLRHVGVAASFSAPERRRLVDRLVSLSMPLRGHPWEGGFNLAGSPVGRLAGAAGRWDPGMEPDWVPLRPELVCEVAYDQLDGQRFRHAARFVRWRPDREASSCSLDQLEVEPVPLDGLLAGS